MSAPNPMDDLRRRALTLVQQGRFRTLEEALRALQAGGPGGQLPAAANSPRGMRPPDGGPNPAFGPAPAGPGQVRGPVDQPRGMRPPGGGPNPAFGPAPPGPGAPAANPGRGPGTTSPGYYRPGAPQGQDQYGGTMTANTNAAGLQSNGDDDPWKIGAAVGTTYDPETLHRWYQRMQAGDGEAAWVLRQIGFVDEQNRPIFQGPDGLEQWANSRKLDRRAADGAGSPWYHDPKNWGADYGFGGEADAMAAFDQSPWMQMPGEGDGPSGWRPERQAPAGSVRYGAPGALPEPGHQTVPGDDWPRAGYQPTSASGIKPRPPQQVQPDGSAGHGQPPTRLAQPTQAFGEFIAGKGQPQSSGPDPLYPQEMKPDGSVGHRDTPLDGGWQVKKRQEEEPIWMQDVSRWY